MNQASAIFEKLVVLENSESLEFIEGISGGPLTGQTQLFFLTIEVSEMIPYRQAKPYEDVSSLTDLYHNKGWSLRRISNELSCSKTTVRKKLTEAGIAINEQSGTDHRSLRHKMTELRKRGLSSQAIADLFNLWKVPTRTKEGKWHGKTILEMLGMSG